MKHGQLTAAIIVGLTVLIAAGLLLFIRLQASDRELMPELDRVPGEFAEVQRFVLECSKGVALEGMQRIGEHGGYLDPRDAAMSGRSFNLGAQPTESDVVYVNPQYPVPYWWHMRPPTKCSICEVTDEQRPALEEIELQLNRYVEAKIDSCLGEFEQFEAQGITVRRAGNAKVSTVIRDKDISVHLEYPLSMSRGGKETSAKSFPVTLNIPFKDMYVLALAIALGQQDNMYLETMLMHLISSYSAVDAERLPPLSSFDEGFEVVMWMKSTVQTQLTQLLQSHVPLFQVENTANFELLKSDDPFQEAMYRVFTLSNNNRHQGLEVQFMYLGWPLYFDIRPRNGEVLRPISTRREYPWGIMPLTQTNQYEFFYDVSFPVIVEVRDPAALDNSGYSLVFALEGTVFDNKNLGLWHVGEGTIGPYDYSEVEVSFDKSTELAYKEYVPELKLEAERTLTKPAKKMFCSDNQRVSGEVEVLVESYGAPVAGAEITYGCGRYASCSIGATDEQGRYRGRFPVCVGGGYVGVTSRGYAPAAASSLTTLPEEESRFVVNLKPLKELEAGALLIPDHMAGLYARDSAGVLEERHEAIINVQRVREDPFEESSSQTLVVGPEERARLYLAEGRYTFYATLVDKEGFLIPGHEEKIGIQSVTVPEMQMKPAVMGGAVAGHDSGLWIVNRLNLQKDSLTFYLFSHKTPTTTSEVMNLTAYESLSQKHRSLIEPLFG